MSGAFDGLYASTGPPSIPPEMLLRALLLQAFYGLRSERQLLERLEFDLRWFVGLGIDTAVWDASTFSKNRDRLLEGDAAAALFAAIVAHPKVRLISTEHFSVDGTLIEAWASNEELQADDRGRGPARRWRTAAGRRRRPERRGELPRRATGERDACLGHRSGRLAVPQQLRHRGGAVLQLDVVPHVAQNTAGRRSANDRRTTRHPGHAASQGIPKRIEEFFRWTKSSAGNPGSEVSPASASPSLLGRSLFARTCPFASACSASF